jgi:hypothetical protein
MSTFITELDGRCREDALWLLLSPLIYKSDVLGCIIEVPEGFVTDFASVPRVPFAYMVWGDRAHHESVVHDYLYRLDSEPMVTKHQADLVFKEAMQCRGKSPMIYWPMYLGVVFGGFSAYHKKKVNT